jgi:hypothetical protein
MLPRLELLLQPYVRNCHHLRGRLERPKLLRRLMPGQLNIDQRPRAPHEGVCAFRVTNDEVPRLLAGCDECFISISDAAAELVASQIIPDVSHWVQLRRIGRQRQSRSRCALQKVLPKEVSMCRRLGRNFLRHNCGRWSWTSKLLDNPIK